MKRSTLGGAFVAVLRDAWLMLGLTLLLFLILEGGYRLLEDSHAAGSRAKGVDPSLHPYAHESWWHEFITTSGFRAPNRYDAYRTWAAEPYHSPNLHVDSNGVRVTIPGPEDSLTARKIFMLGGSEMFGVTARDSFTIASLLAVRLRDLGFRNIAVTNLALPGYNTTQETVTLMLALAKGNVPDVVVTVDGYNDMLTALYFGEPGHTFAEPQVEAILAQSRSGFWGDLLGLGRHSMLIRHLAGPAPEKDAGLAIRDTVCPRTAAYYRSMTQIIEAMGKRYGFHTLFFQQPLDVLSGKPRTRWEKSFARPPNRAQFFLQCSHAIDSVMADHGGLTYFPLGHLFDGDTTTVFVDRDSHITEAAHRTVADEIAARVAPLLKEEVPRP
jgi:hypothetical protein